MKRRIKLTDLFSQHEIDKVKEHFKSLSGWEQYMYGLSVGSHINRAIREKFPDTPTIPRRTRSILSKEFAVSSPLRY